jgi:hypothetical protein
MTDNIENISINMEQLVDEEEEYISKLSLVIRKVQEGKTYICISGILNDKTKDIHIILTMNTLSAGMQLFGRMEEKVGSKNIIVFNSKPSTAGNCHHAKNAVDILKLLLKCPNIKVIVCCAHDTRIKNSLPLLFDISTGHEIFTRNNRKYKLHIDEAHAYIPPHRTQIQLFNDTQIVKNIIGYTGTPNKIWVDTIRNSSDKIFRKILIRDVEEELQIIRSPDYFGVTDCDIKIYENEIDEDKLIDMVKIDPTIPELSFVRANMTEGNRRLWYGSNYYFDLGNELLLLSFVTYILPLLQIAQTGFSYHFIPAYVRKATHYQIMEIILGLFPDANVIIMNGNGTDLYRKHSITKKSREISNGQKLFQANKDNKEEIKKLLEPAYMIQKLIENHNNFPTFVTGFTCVGMSVSLINQITGNFDNVVFAHQHFSSDKLYQLCRFLFNYSCWSNENKLKIKATKIHSLTSHVYETIAQYEDDVEKMSTEWVGKVCSLREIQGLEELPPSETEIKIEELNTIELLNKDSLWKRFAVVDGNDDEQWEKVRKFYKNITGKELRGKSMPTIKDDGFYHCSTTKNVVKHTKSDIQKLSDQSWWSMFQLLPDKFTYARVFVGYHDESDPTEYYIYIKYVSIIESDESRNIINKYGKKKNKSALIIDDDNESSTPSENEVIGNIDI